jgi:hypothetical protein
MHRLRPKRLASQPAHDRTDDLPDDHRRGDQLLLVNTEVELFGDEQQRPGDIRQVIAVDHPDGGRDGGHVAPQT